MFVDEQSPVHLGIGLYLDPPSSVPTAMHFLPQRISRCVSLVSRCVRCTPDLDGIPSSDLDGLPSEDLDLLYELDHFCSFSLFPSQITP